MSRVAPDYGRYNKTSFSPDIIIGIESPDLGQCVGSLRACMTFLTGSHSWPEALERALVEACVTALVNHNEQLEVRGPLFACKAVNLLNRQPPAV